MGKASGGEGPRIGPPMAPPPYIGTWGRGKKTKGLKAGVKHLGLKNRLQPQRPVAPLERPVFKKTVPMNNFDLLEWCQYLKIPIKNVLKCH